MFAVEWAAVLVDDRSPSGQRTDWPEVVAEAEHPRAYPPYQPCRCCGPALSTCYPSWPAGRKGIETGVAAAASDGGPCALRTAHRHYPVVPCLAERSDRIDSRRPFFKC